MRATIRVCGDKEGEASTEAHIEIAQSWEWVTLKADANWEVDLFSMRPNEARVLALALNEAAALAENAKGKQ